MDILQKIKSLLGLGSNGSEPGETETTVTVERESDDLGDEPVDGETPDEDEEIESDDDEAAEPYDDEAAEPDDDEATESDDDEAAEPDDDEAAEPDDDEAAESDDDEAAEPDDDEEAEPDDDEAAESDDDEEVEPDDDEAAESDDDEEVEPDDGVEDGDSVELIKGIGPAYGERLATAGILTVDQLAAADPGEVAEEASVSENRASTWIERAKEF